MVRGPLHRASIFVPLDEFVPLDAPDPRSPDATLRCRNTGGEHTDGGGTGGPHGLRLRVRFLLSYADDDAIRRASAQRTAATIAGDSAIARPPGATSRRRRAAPQHASVCVPLVRAAIRVPTRG